MTTEAAAWRRRDLAGTCPTCRAVPGQPCRTSFSTERHPKPPGWSNAESGVTGSWVVEFYGPSLNRPHAARLLASIFGARP